MQNTEPYTESDFDYAPGEPDIMGNFNFRLKDKRLGTFSPPSRKLYRDQNLAYTDFLIAAVEEAKRTNREREKKRR